MISFFYNNQSLIVVIGVALFLFILYLLVKKLPTKVEKKEKSADKKPKVEKVYKPEEPASKKEEPEKQEPKTIEPDIEQEEKKEVETEGKAKKQDKKPKIVQVFKREPATQEVKTEKNDPIYDRNVEFVNTSKNIAKFKSFKEEEKPQENNEKNDEFGFVTDKQEDCEYCEDHVKHFDHSRRLSKYINDDDDKMFGSHISDHYLNINVNRHLNVDESKIFARTDSMMDNTETRVSGTNDDRFGYARDWFNSNEENEIETRPDNNRNIDVRTAVIAEAYMKRKKRK